VKLCFATTIYALCCRRGQPHEFLPKGNKRWGGVEKFQIDGTTTKTKIKQLTVSML